MSNPARYAAVLMCVVLAGCDAASPRTEDRTFTAPARDTLYTTPYGSFRTIDKVWQNNEYMLAHPSVPGAELCTAYLTDDPAQADEVRDELRALADEITAGCTTEYEKAEALAMWTGLNIAYDYANEDGGLEVMTAQSVLRDRRTVCTGFANLFSCLCAAEDIYCLFLIGGTSSGG
ncbi:MAG: transglutaminase domain-containing protein, partial [Oscillospiraceae bacterium]|nr:transglutaminase domain-containing protein [Oscillospiraceae bacterium]